MREWGSQRETERHQREPGDRNNVTDAAGEIPEDASLASELGRGQGGEGTLGWFWEYPHTFEHRG